jgi:hypothetical protein
MAMVSFTHPSRNAMCPRLSSPYISPLAHASLLLRPSPMSLYGDFLAHATDWKASAAECANARRSTLSATMDTAGMDMLLGIARIWHDR